MDKTMSFEFYNKHYVSVDDKNRIIDGWSDGPHPEKYTENAVCINDKGGYQFRLFPGGEENPRLWTVDGIPLYKYVNETVQKRSREEVKADRALIPPPPPSPSPMEQLRADVDFIAAMGGVEL